MKNYIGPNECSPGRWCAVLLAGLLIGNVLALPLAFYGRNAAGIFMGIPCSGIVSMLTFGALFAGMAIAVRFVGKTPLKAFVLGVGGKVNKKECLTVLGLYVGGLALSCLPVLGNIRPRGVDAGEFGFLVLFMLLTVWLQTTWEELIFRGLVIRWVCGNDARYTKSAVMAGILSAAVFALEHASGPEVTSQSGILAAVAVAAYGVYGMLLFLADLHFGSLLPGIVMHWVNNFLLFTLIGSEVTSLPLPTLLVDTTPRSAGWMLLSAGIVCLPLTAYMILDTRKKRRAASAC